MNLEEEKKKFKEILDNMSVEEFDNMLERCGINETEGYRKDSLIRSKRQRYADANQIINNICENTIMNVCAVRLKN